jgi:hypothetical protein
MKPPDLTNGRRCPMPEHLAVTDFRLVVASLDDRARGLLFFVSFTYGALRIDGVTVRRTRDGRVVLSFPTRHDRSGRQHALIRPLDDETRRALEAQVFSALDLKQETGP